MKNLQKAMTRTSEMKFSVRALDPALPLPGRETQSENPLLLLRHRRP